MFSGEKTDPAPPTPSSSAEKKGVAKKSTAEIRKTTTSEIRSPLLVQRELVQERLRRKGIAEQLYVALKGKRLKPGEIMTLVSDVLPEMQEVSGAEAQNRYQEVQNGYIFLEYLQATLSGEVRLVPAEVVTNTMLGLLAWVGDMASGGNFYERSKRRWWGLLVNRPDRHEKQPPLKDKNLNSSDASYVELYHFNDTVRRMTSMDQIGAGGTTLAMTAFAYEQLRALVVHRRERVAAMPKGEEVTLPFAAISKKDIYTIVIHRGPWARKVAIKGEWIEDERFFPDFHRYLGTMMAEPIPVNSAQPTAWIDTRPASQRDKLRKEGQKGRYGNESVDTAKKSRLDKSDLTAADLSVTVGRSHEMTLDKLQQDYRTDTYGIGIPVTIAFGLNRDGSLDSYATKHAHPYTDGAHGVIESKEIANRVFEKRLTKLSIAVVDNIPQPTEGQTLTEKLHQKPVVREKVLPKERFVKRINVIREFFSDESNIQRLLVAHPKLRGKEAMIRNLADSINIQNILTLAVMSAFDHRHAHFLEAVKMNDQDGNARAVGLAPAIAVMSNELRNHITIRRLGPLHEDVMLDLLTAVSVLDVSRDMTRRGKGAAHIFDTLLAIKALKVSMQGAGNILDAQKSAMLTDTTMMSFLVKGDGVWGTPNEYLSLQGFSTAFADTYPDEVFGACDRINPETGEEEIVVTVRRRPNAEGKVQERLSPVGRLEMLDIHLDRILIYLEQFITEQPFQTPESLEKTSARRPVGAGKLKPNSSR